MCPLLQSWIKVRKKNVFQNICYRNYRYKHYDIMDFWRKYGFFLWVCIRILSFIFIFFYSTLLFWYVFEKERDAMSCQLLNPTLHVVKFHVVASVGQVLQVSSCSPACEYKLVPLSVFFFPLQVIMIWLCIFFSVFFYHNILSEPRVTCLSSKSHWSC